VSTLDGRDARRAAMRLVLWQAATTVVLAAICLIGLDARAAISAMLGGGISVAASFAMVLFMFRGAPGTDAKRIVRGAYQGEGAKLALTIVLFVAVLKTYEVAALPFFVAYAATLLAYWIALVKSEAP
jgi:ATP synthase protein I